MSTSQVPSADGEVPPPVPRFLYLCLGLRVAPRWSQWVLRDIARRDWPKRLARRWKIALLSWVVVVATAAFLLVPRDGFRGQVTALLPLGWGAAAASWILTRASAAVIKRHEIELRKAMVAYQAGGPRWWRAGGRLTPRALVMESLVDLFPRGQTTPLVGWLLGMAVVAGALVALR